MQKQQSICFKATNDHYRLIWFTKLLQLSISFYLSIPPSTGKITPGEQNLKVTAQPQLVAYCKAQTHVLIWET